MTTAVDWVQLRKNILLSTQRIELYSPDYWNKEVNVVNENLPHWAELTKKQLKQLPLTPQITVLDVGAGTGRMTIPIAKRVKHVTALEPSEKMLAALRENARRQQVFNLFCINESLEELEITNSYDLVIASFSLFMFDIKSALLKMNALASKAVYLFLSASPWVDEEMQKALYGNASPWSDFIFIYNILHDAGILANVKISEYNLKQSYVDLEDAVSKYLQTYHIPIEKQDKLREYIQTVSIEENGKIWCNRKRKAATIWWTTNK
jgi:ubiquinone/menaquinone biosynthesis C-methylase UbiE